MNKIPGFVSYILLLSSLTALAAGPAGYWPQWRGPNRDGISTETGLLKQWPAGGPPLAWKAKGLGLGHATVSVAGTRIYSAGDKGESSYVIALNFADGKPIWSSKLGKAGAPGWGGFAGPRSTPTVDGNLIFAVGQWGEMSVEENEWCGHQPAPLRICMCLAVDHSS